MNRADLRVAWWGPMSWGIVLVESLVLLYLWLSRQGQDQVSHYVRHREWLLGVEGQHFSPLLPQLVVNVLIVAALWAAHRGTRLEQSRHAGVMRVGAIGLALVLAALSWNAYLLVRMYPPLEISKVIERSSDGSYERYDP